MLQVPCEFNVGYTLSFLRQRVACNIEYYIVAYHNETQLNKYINVRYVRLVNNKRKEEIHYNKQNEKRISLT